jgi:hypothetical protein
MPLDSAGTTLAGSPHREVTASFRRALQLRDATSRHVVGRPSSAKDAPDALFAGFPAGTVSGAQVRACQVIAARARNARRSRPAASAGRPDGRSIAYRAAHAGKTGSCTSRRRRHRRRQRPAHEQRETQPSARRRRVRCEAGTGGEACRDSHSSASRPPEPTETNQDQRCKRSVPGRCGSVASTPRIRARRAQACNATRTSRRRTRTRRVSAEPPARRQVRQTGMSRRPFKPAGARCAPAAGPRRKNIG